MTETEFYQHHLNGVSRSFALCIARLQQPLRDWVGLTYLLCRVLDTIEDAAWPDKNEQLQAYDLFHQFLLHPAAEQKLNHWQKSFPQNIPDSEKELIQQSRQLFLNFQALESRVQAPLLKLLNSMRGGMSYFTEQKKSGVLRLESLQQVNQYCLFVAGVVGEALSQLLALVDKNVQLHRAWLVDAHHFGLFLQKVNLLKDQAQDESEGRMLIPARQAVYASLSENAEGAMRYIESVPLKDKPYRVFCLWSFFLGLRTLPILKMNNADKLKLGRAATLLLFTKVEAIANKPDQLRKYFHKLMSAAQLNVKQDTDSLSNVTSSAVPLVLNQYQGELDFAELQQLRLI